MPFQFNRSLGYSSNNSELSFERPLDKILPLVHDDIAIGYTK